MCRLLEKGREGTELVEEKKEKNRGWTNESAETEQILTCPHFPHLLQEDLSKTSQGVFREKRLSPNLDFSAAATLKNRSRSAISNQFFVMSAFCIHEHLVRIQPLVHKILCRQESVTPTPMPTQMGSAPKSIYPPPRMLGAYLLMMNLLTVVN